MFYNCTREENPENGWPICVTVLIVRRRKNSKIQGLMFVFSLNMATPPLSTESKLKINSSRPDGSQRALPIPPRDDPSLFLASR